MQSERKLYIHRVSSEDEEEVAVEVVAAADVVVADVDVPGAASSKLAKWGVWLEINEKWEIIKLIR